MRFADVLKFFGCELGAQTKFSGESGTCIVNGGQPLPRPCSSAELLTSARRALGGIECGIMLQLYPEVANLGGLAAGAHEVGTLDDLLEKFTKKYVQCFSCGNPETRVRIKKGNIFLKCKVWAWVVAWHAAPPVQPPFTASQAAASTNCQLLKTHCLVTHARCLLNPRIQDSSLQGSFSFMSRMQGAAAIDAALWL